MWSRHSEPWSTEHSGRLGERHWSHGPRQSPDHASSPDDTRWSCAPRPVGRRQLHAGPAAIVTRATDVAACRVVVGERPVIQSRAGQRNVGAARHPTPWRAQARRPRLCHGAANTIRTVMPGWRMETCASHDANVGGGCPPDMRSHRHAGARPSCHGPDGFKRAWWSRFEPGTWVTVFAICPRPCARYARPMPAVPKRPRERLSEPRCDAESRGGLTCRQGRPAPRE